MAANAHAACSMTGKAVVMHNIPRLFMPRPHYFTHHGSPSGSRHNM
ncbi:TPA: hypothetical protein ACY3XX_003970 [Yersinia enterocolitica]|uniref:Uncharacterized protein n=2 Tax=Yersinia enterocolitica TaxID=630 RepID=A0A0H3NZD0_YERE1|nr:hypothetical protein [Yersinia enterocolitica]EKN3316071.1 hypothetical protein [Yersinia enterocolitica]EKN3319923.1 hypothetical protein [Yersinia enterocolitica]EKN3323850.1 hypothetical protein [Yersinia enterocolitica]EKN3327848.1 hypothetical protein [Yersinia enterocolitica]EKN3332095.1 hypothetical protein [Yersinia enterocolitica]